MSDFAGRRRRARPKGTLRNGRFSEGDDCLKRTHQILYFGDTRQPAQFPIEATYSLVSIFLTQSAKAAENSPARQIKALELEM
jgi:hypothetical protein